VVRPRQKLLESTSHNLVGCVNGALPSVARVGPVKNEKGREDNHPKHETTSAMVCPDVTDWAWLYKETARVLDVYEGRVREGKDLAAALEFARYLQWSGLIKMFKAHANDETGMFKVDGAFLQWKIEELQRMVRDRYRKGDSEPHITETQLEAINRKLDLLAGHIAQTTPERVPAPVVELKVLPDVS